MNELGRKVIGGLTGEGAVFDGPKEVEAFRLGMLVKALALEVRTGMKMSRVSALSIAKNQYGCKGNKVNCYKQLCKQFQTISGHDLSHLIAPKPAAV